MDEITLMSFGFYHGLPVDANTVLDVRGLPNPFWVEELKNRTGLDAEVRDYVFSTEEAEGYYRSALDLIRRRVAFHEAYKSPLKQPLVIAVGCTGGRHRSVSTICRLAEALRADGKEVCVIHRDIEKR